MAVQSVGGAEATETPGAVSADGVIPAGSSASSPAAGPEAGAPYAIIDGKSFKDQAELTTWWDTGRGQDTQGGDSGTDSVAAGSGNDTLVGGQGNDAIQETDEALLARLKEAGGIYADERYAPFALEFEKSGGKGLSEESLKKAAAAFGQSVEVIKQFIDGQVATRQLAAATAGQPSAEQVATAAAILEVVPAEADYKAILEWGKEGLTAGERSAYDGALDRGDKETVKALLGSFVAKMNAAGAGKGPRDATTEGSGADGGNAPAATPYASQAQMSADMSKPQYATDPAFRAEVQARLAVSKF